MVIKHNLIIGNINTLDYDAVVDGSGTFGAPVRVYETIEVDGKSGNLLIDKGRFENQDVEYQIMFNNREDIERFRNDISSLIGYVRLEDSHHPDEYRLARINEVDIEVSGINNRWGIVTVSFDCKPQRFLKTGEETVTITASSGNVTNPTYYDALPMIRVYGYGTLTVGNYTAIIASYGKTYIDIDCELMDCFNGQTNLNSYVTLSSTQFPKFGKGNTNISKTSRITKVEIIPRWWRL